MSYEFVRLSDDRCLTNARIWAVWSDYLHSVVYMSIHKSDCDKMAKIYNQDNPHLFVVRFDLSPIYKPLGKTVTCSASPVGCRFSGKGENSKKVRSNQK